MFRNSSGSAILTCLILNILSSEIPRQLLSGIRGGTMVELEGGVNISIDDLMDFKRKLELANTIL